MSYEPTNWQTGDIVSSQRLNKMEQGIAGAGSGVLVVNASYDEQTETITLDKTWQEIHDAPVAILIMVNPADEGVTQILYKAGDGNDETYGCDVTFSVFVRQGVSSSHTFNADSPSGYPVEEVDDLGGQN